MKLKVFFPVKSLILLVILFTPVTIFGQEQKEENTTPPLTTSSNEEELPPTEIHITGALTPMGLERMGKPISVITHKELQERSEPTIGELLASEPGVSSTYFGPGASRPVIRGQSKERVRVIENGLESGDVSRVSEDHAVATDPLTIQRVDILRGPSTLMYGSGAIGGVVNMIDQNIAEENIGKTITGEMDFRKGDPADEEISGAALLNGQAGTINWHFSGFYRNTDDIEIPGFAESKRLREMEALEEQDEHEHEEGEEHEHEEDEEVKNILPNSDTLAKGFKVGASHVWDKGFVGLALKMNGSKYGVPGGHEHHHEEEEDHDDHEEEDHSEEGVKIDLDQIRLESRGQVELDDDFFHAIRFGASYSDYEHKELEGDEVGTRFKNKAFESRVELTHIHDDGFEGGMGSQIRYEDFQASGEEAFVPASETFAPALFAVEDYKISDRLVLQLGGRYEYSNVNPENQNAEDFNMFSSSFGAVRNLDADNNYSLAWNASYSERSPTATELFADGQHVATQTFEIGDPSLSKEKSVGSELVFRKNHGRLTGSSSLFWQHYFDYINLAPNGEEEDDVPVYLYEMAEARFWGFESEANLQLLTDSAHGLSLYGQIDYVRGENLSNNDPLPRITPLRGKIGLKYEYDEASAYIENIMVDEQDKTADFELPTDSYNLLNAGVSYQIPLNSRQNYELYARATNLTDEEARVHNSFLKDVAPLRGRAFLAGLRFHF